MNRSITYAEKAADGILGGAIKSSEGNVLLGASRVFSNVAKQSVSNRMTRGRLIAQEAKLIEGDAA